jgi:hypothetical protein
MQMLFGGGRADMAAFAADRPLAAPPGTRYNYSTGSSMVISGIVARALGSGGPYRSYLDDRLFGPLGMSSATATFDDAGSWVAGSFVHATARDFARFGLLYLRDGVWGGRRLLPEGWVDSGRRPRSVDPDDGNLYGHHWWTRDDPLGTFWAAGHDGQFHRPGPGFGPGDRPSGPDGAGPDTGIAGLAGRGDQRVPGFPRGRRRRMMEWWTTTSVGPLCGRPSGPVMHGDPEGNHRSFGIFRGYRSAPA